MGSGVSAIALVIAVYDRTESGAAVGGLLLARALPSVAAPFAGVIIDRVDRRLAMIASDLASAGLIIAVAFAGPLPVVYALVVLLGVALAVFTPAERSSIARLVAPADLPAANSFSNLTRTSSVFLGSVLGGALVATLGLRPAFFLDAASFIVAAALSAALPSLAPRDEERAAAAGYWQELREGLTVVLRERVPFTVVFTGFSLVLFASLMNAVQVILAKALRPRTMSAAEPASMPTAQAASSSPYPRSPASSRAFARITWTAFIRPANSTSEKPVTTTVNGTRSRSTTVSPSRSSGQ